MDVQAFIDSLTSDPAYAGQIVHVRTEPARTAVWAGLPGGLHPGVRAFLTGHGISRLYRHQAEAVSAALGGEDVLVTTSAASGKSLCYQIPLLHALLSEASSTALLLFPTKALARDQASAWNRGIAAVGAAGDARSLEAAAFDADAGAADRRRARDSGRILITNPEMLHTNLLPNHGRWARFFAGLRFVIIDEVHTYNGFFGANMANVMRRLARVCEHYQAPEGGGGRPRFICLSATLGNAAEAAGLITGRPPHHVGDDASAGGRRTYVFWNPPRIKDRQWRGRRSANVEAHELMVRLVSARVPTICFSKARNTAEMIYRYVREGLTAVAPQLAGRVVVYRGGYGAQERRDMERRLREGELLGVSATRALELGIDIGMIDACIIVGYPGTVNAFLQQAGRAGRSGRDSLCILVGIDTAINQYIMAHPEFIFGRPVEQAVIDRDNPFVVMGHVRCAAAELPITPEEPDRFGYAQDLALEVLAEKEKVRRIGNAWHHCSAEQPAFEVRLRGYGDESTVVQDADSGEVLDRIDKFRALRVFYPGAIYFHRGDTYAMVEHDAGRNLVRVRRVDVSYYTDPLAGTSVDHVDRILDRRPIGRGQAFLGEVFAVLTTPLYERVPFYSMDRISRHPVDLPSVSYDAMSFWVTTPPDIPAGAAALGLNAGSGMKGILYCVSRVLPLFHTSDTNDFDWTLGCRNTPWHTMFWYEFYMHGIGHAEQCFERLEDILAVALEHLLTCDCEDGCPNCTSRLITPYHVRNIELGEGEVMSRRAAVVILNSLLTGASAQAGLDLLGLPRQRRGQAFLPTVTLDRRHAQPHRMPLDERTRRLMLRKLERPRNPTEAINHVIEPVPPSGIPAVESRGTVGRTDSEMRSGVAAIRHRGGALSKALRKRLPLVKGQGQPAAHGRDPEAGDVQRAAGPSEVTPDSRPQAGDALKKGIARMGSAGAGQATAAAPTEATARPLPHTRPERADTDPGPPTAIEAGDAIARRVLRKMRGSRGGR